MTEHPLLARILEVISPASEVGSELEWELIARLVSETPAQDLARLIVDAAPRGVEPWRVGALFDHLVWNTPDNGESVVRACEAWLRGDDYRKITFVLAMTYVFPFRDVARMSAALNRIATRWPELAGRCQDLIDRRSIHDRRRT